MFCLIDSYMVVCLTLYWAVCWIKSTTGMNRVKERKVVSGKSDNNSGCLYDTDVHLAIHIKLRILEGAVRICSLDGSRTRKENVNEGEMCGSGEIGELKDRWLE